MGRAFSTSYLAGEPAAGAFLSRDFRRPADRLAAARAATARRPDPALVAVLRQQQAALPPSAARDQNLEALAGGRAVAVVTGQQVGLFLGPLYTFYKAATAIAVARALQAESGIACVPLFWLQTEDHDFAEIASCTSAGAGGAPARLTLEDGPAELERVSVAHRRLGPEVTRLLDDLAGLLEGAPAASEVLALLGRHYRPGRPVAGAFAGALAEVFADSGAGLLFLDPRDARVAELAAPVYRRALTDAAAIDRLLTDRVSHLEAAGFQAQIGVRAGSPLVFFHPQGATGPRYRLQSDPAPPNGQDRQEDNQDSWRLAGGTARVSHAALLEALASDPLHFSTSALLRPIVQDALLPTAAYVGGPAEVSYFAQLEPLYAHFGIDPPLVVPRARFRCVDARARRRLGELGLGPEDLARPLPELLAQVAVRVAGPVAVGVDGAGPPRQPDPGELRRRAASEVAPLVAEIASAIAAAEPSLARAAERTRASTNHALKRLTDRYARRLAERDGVTRRRLEQLRDLLYPGGVAQERVFGWPWLAARLGSAALHSLVGEALAGGGPFDPAIRELRP